VLANANFDLVTSSVRDERAFFVAAGDAPAKQAILQAALRLFARQGVAATSVRAIAKEAGYTNPALFKHFAGKEELVAYLFERCYLRLGAEVQAAILGQTGFAAQLRQVVRRYVATLVEEPDAVLFVNDNLRALWPQLRGRLRRVSILGQLRALVTAGRNEGLVSEAEPAEIQVAAIAGTLAQVARLYAFDELSGPVEAWLPGVERVIERAVCRDR
jgi:AcrR family transcriptional regulator